MANKKIPVYVAQAMYEEDMQPIWEAQRIASEMEACYEQFAKEAPERMAKAAARIAEETEESWEEYEDKIFWREACDEYDTIREINAFYEGETVSEPVQENPESQHIRTRTQSYRRKQDVKSKRKLRRNAVNAMNNICKRIGEDMNNMTFCKRRGGQEVRMPKSLSMKAESVWARAAKMKLVEATPA